MSERSTEYLNDLLRGRELVLGLEVPLLNRYEILGRVSELKVLWLNAPQEDRNYIEQSLSSQDSFIAAHMPDDPAPQAEAGDALDLTEPGGVSSWRELRRQKRSSTTVNDALDYIDALIREVESLRKRIAELESDDRDYSWLLNDCQTTRDRVRAQRLDAARESGGPHGK